jgi:hypothetical protein
MSVHIYQFTRLNNTEDLNFHNYETFVPRKVGKTLTQHIYYYIFEKKYFEIVVNEQKRSMLAEMTPTAAAGKGNFFGCLYITVRYTTCTETHLRPILWCWRPLSCP